MLARLALGNVRRSARDYAVYFVTLVLGVAVFYAFNTISNQADFLKPEYGAILGMLGNVMVGLTVFLAFVLGFLMVYANNYLMRRRKRELGLYQVLGMRRSQVSVILMLETLMVSAVSLAVGVGLGVLASQMLVFVTAALFHEQVTAFSFQFSPEALAMTLACFGIMFVVMLLFNLHTLGRVRLIDLMGAERANERIKVRNLPLSLALFVTGCALIGVAYGRLLHDGLPIDGTDDAQLRFLVTTALMVGGTLLFFYALSGFLLIAARRLPGVYWRGLNMFTVRQLGAKINTSSVSMAVISIILFLAITSVTGGMSICNTLTGNVEQHTPCDASICVAYYGENAWSSLDTGSLKDKAGVATTDLDYVALLAQAGYDLEGLGDVAVLNLKDATLAMDDPAAGSISAMAQATGQAIPTGMESSDLDSADIGVIGLSEFNAWRALLGLDPIELGENGYAIANDMGEDLTRFYDGVLGQGYCLTIAGVGLVPAVETTIDDLSASVADMPMGSNPGCLIVPDAVADACAPYEAYVNVMYGPGVTTEEGDSFIAGLDDLDTSALFVEDGKWVAYTGTVVTATENWSSVNGLSGVISYMAIYIGFVLVIACAAILAIQQLSSTSDSVPRYRLLSELGCPTRLAYRSLLTQSLVYFLFPLVVGLTHSFVALQVVTGLVALFGHLDIVQSSVMTAALFVAVYGGYLFVTYRVSRGVVRGSLVGA